MVEQMPKTGMVIEGYGATVPETIMTNADIVESIKSHDGPDNITAEWIEKMTGIVERPHAKPEKGEDTASLAVAAGRLAIEKADIDPSTINNLIVATSTSPKQLPVTYNRVQDELGLQKCFCFDLGAACSGFVHGMIVANGLLATGNDGDRTLVIGAETADLITDQSDPDTAPIFASGAGAMVLKRVDGSPSGILGKSSDNDGSRRHFFEAEHGGKIRMQGTKLAIAISRMVPELIKAALENANIVAEDVDFVSMHQPNGRIIDIVNTRLGIAKEKIGRTIDRFGNTSAATVPQNYAYFRDRGIIRPGQIVVFNGVAVGIGGSTIVTRI